MKEEVTYRSIESGDMILDNRLSKPEEQIIQKSVHLSKEIGHKKPD